MEEVGFHAHTVASQQVETLWLHACGAVMSSIFIHGLWFALERETSVSISGSASMFVYAGITVIEQ